MSENILSEKQQALFNFSKDALEFAANAGPEYNYLTFSIYTVFIPHLISKAIAHAAHMQSASMGIAWNMLDAVYSIALGIYQYLQKNHHPLESKTKGVTNILSGAQLVILTFLGLGGPGFAAAFGLGFLHSIWDTCKLTYCYYDDKYRHQECTKERGFLEALLTEEKSILQTITHIDNKDQINPKLLSWLNLLQTQTESHINTLEERKLYLDGNLKFQKTKLKTDISQSIYNTLVWGAAFTGMLLVCLPGFEIPALTLIALATTMYLYRHAPEIASFCFKISKVKKNASFPEIIETLFYNKQSFKETQEHDGLNSIKRA